MASRRSTRRTPAEVRALAVLKSGRNPKDRRRKLTPRQRAYYKGVVTRESGRRKRERERDKRAKAAQAKRAAPKRRDRYRGWGALRRAREICKRIADVYGGGVRPALEGMDEELTEEVDTHRPARWARSFAIFEEPFPLPPEGASRPPPPRFGGLVKRGRWRAGARLLVEIRNLRTGAPEGVGWYSANNWTGSAELLRQGVDLSIKNLGVQPSTKGGVVLACDALVTKGNRLR